MTLWLTVALEVCVWQALKKELLLSRKNSELVGGIISTMPARKLIFQGVDGYLAHIMDTPKSRSEVNQVPVVREFTDLSLEELLNMPKDKEIEFSI